MIIRVVINRGPEQQDSRTPYMGVVYRVVFILRTKIARIVSVKKIKTAKYYII